MASIPDLLKKFDASVPGEWKYQEPKFGLLETEYQIHPTWVNERDVNLRIEQGDVVVNNFEEEWSEKVPNPEKNRSRAFWLVYNRSPIKRYVAVAVDGSRANVPLPDRPETDDGPWTITEDQDKLGRIISNDEREYQHVLNMCDIEVV